MGLADREYMRERTRERARAPSPVWSQGRRYRPNLRQGLIFLLCALPTLTGAYHAAKRAGWGLPEMRQEVDFPQSGDVVVNRSVNPRSATSRFLVTTADANAVAQLYRLDDTHVLSVFVRKNDQVTTPAPPGRYRLRVEEGQKWYGSKVFFGSSMTHEEAVETIELTPAKGSGIDLHRDPSQLLERASPALRAVVDPQSILAVFVVENDHKMISIPARVNLHGLVGLDKKPGDRQ